MRGLRGYGAFSTLQIHGLLHTQRIALAEDVSAWDITIEVERRKEGRQAKCDDDQPELSLSPISEET